MKAESSSAFFFLFLSPCECDDMLKKFSKRRADGFEHAWERRALMEHGRRIRLQKIRSAARDDEIRIGKMRKLERPVRSPRDIRYEIFHLMREMARNNVSILPLAFCMRIVVERTFRKLDVRGRQSIYILAAKIFDDADRRMLSAHVFFD